MRFDIVMSFLLAPRCHRVANLHDCAAMLRCWDSFWHHDALYARAQIPLCGQFAILLRHVALLRFILELLSAHFGCILISCCALGIHFEAVIWPFWERFGIMLCFMLAPRCHPVAIVHPFDAMSRCWCHFGAVIWLFWGHFDIMLCFMLASRCHTRGHCARFCRRVTLLGFIWRHRVVILGAFWHHTELYSPIHIHYVAIVHDFATMLRCWDSFWHHDALYARAQIPLCDQLAYFYAMLRCWDLFWSCYLPILDAFWYHVAL